MKGNKVYRHKQNPEEKRFHDAFVEDHNNINMSSIIFEPNSRGIEPNEYLSPREEKIVISAMQWLGSSVG